MKTQVDQLALLGGEPLFDKPTHVGRPNIGNRQRFLDRVNDLLDRRILTNDGPYVTAFEQAVAQLVGAKHCVAVCNGTVGLELLIKAAGLSGEVILPSFTFVATAHALGWLGLTPVFCDVDPDTHNLDPRRVESLITSRTAAILGVHLWGRPCDVDCLSSIARRHGVALLFDAAHALGCSRGQTMIGNFGQAEVFSFHATKICNSFEGGAVVTNDGELAEKIRVMHRFGFAGYDTVISHGTNAKMSEVAAAMGLTSLESLDEFIAHNRLNYEAYRDSLDGLPGISLVDYNKRERNNYQYIVVEVNEEETGLSRDELQQLLWRENILARRYFYPGCHRMEPYRSTVCDASQSLPVTELLAERVLVLPTGTALTPDGVQAICSVIRLACLHNAKLKRRLSQPTLVTSR